MSKKTVAVICGGPSSEHEVSLKSGEQVYRELNEETYHKLMITISKEGNWELTADPDNKLSRAVGEPLNIMHMEKGKSVTDLSGIDVAFIALHGPFGEDGTIQAILETVGIAYTGSGVRAHALAMNKQMTNKYLEGMGIRVPKSLVIHNHQKLSTETVHAHIIDQTGYPRFVKPNESGSSCGASIVESQEVLEASLTTAFKEDTTVLVEEYINGKELTCGVLGNTGETELQALPPVEIICEEDFFDYQAKYHSPTTQEICPADISEELTKEIQDIAVQVHEALGCRGLTRTDFIQSEDGTLYVLEINTLPGLTEQSLCPKEARAAGMTFSEFLDKQISLALE